jgi:hypothetical protein
MTTDSLAFPVADRYTFEEWIPTVFETPQMVQHFEDERADRRGDLVEGRKLLFWALGAYLLFILLSKLIGLPWILAGPLALGIVAASMLGSNKIGLGLNDPPLTRMIFAVSMIIPYIGLAVIIVLLLRAQRGLQTAA